MTVKLLLARSSGFSVKRPSSQRRAIACVVIEHISRSLEHSKTKNDTSSDTLAMVRSGISVIPSVMSFSKKKSKNQPLLIKILVPEARVTFLEEMMLTLVSRYP